MPLPFLAAWLASAAADAKAISRVRHSYLMFAG